MWGLMSGEGCEGYGRRNRWNFGCVMRDLDVVRGRKLKEMGGNE